MTHYRHRQPGHLIRAVFAAISAVLLVMTLRLEPGQTQVLLAGLTAALALTGWLFSSLTVEVTDDVIRWYFGPGFWKKYISRDDITSAVAVRTKLRYGWGIRRIPKGWLYNVSGRQAVALAMGSGQITMIGSDEPEKLVRALGY